jgi:hypothetical protein
MYGLLRSEAAECALVEEAVWRLLYSTRSRKQNVLNKSRAFGRSSTRAALILEEYDYTDIHVLVGGFNAWRVKVLRSKESGRLITDD